MIKEGWRESANSEEQRISGSEQNFDVKAELIRSIEVLSEKLAQLENKEANNPSGKAGSFKGPKDEIDCSFMSTCYTAKHDMGQCPCELRR